MVETVGKKKKKTANHGEMRWTKTVKIATSEIHLSILKRNFTILKRTFLHNFLKEITYKK